MATACFFPKLPRDHPWFLLTAYGLLRLVAIPLAPVPLTVPLDPLPVFLAAVLALPRRHHAPTLTGLLAMLLATDLLGGLSVSHTLLRALPIPLLFFLGHPPARPRAAALFFLFHLAAWSPLLPEFRGDYPYTYLYAVTLLQGLLFHGWLAPILVPASKQPGSNPLRSLAPALGVALLWVLFGPRPPWPPPILGASGGPWLRLFLPLLLALPFLKHLQRRTSPKATRRKKPQSERVSWRDLAD